MKWQPIETAPKDGTEVVLWCEKRKVLLLECMWDKRLHAWCEYTHDSFGNVSWNALEPYEGPTHWLQIIPPREGG